MQLFDLLIIGVILYSILQAVRRAVAPKDSTSGSASEGMERLGSGADRPRLEAERSARAAARGEEAGRWRSPESEPGLPPGRTGRGGVLTELLASVAAQLEEHARQTVPLPSPEPSGGRRPVPLPESAPTAPRFAPPPRSAPPPAVARSASDSDAPARAAPTRARSEEGLSRPETVRPSPADPFPGLADLPPLQRAIVLAEVLGPPRSTAQNP